MKIAIAGGHSAAARGASGYIDEYEKDRAYVAKLIPALEAAGHTVVDCSNEAMSVNGELYAEVSKANESDADYFLAVHFNAGGGTGTECWYYSGNEAGYELADTMSSNVAGALGLCNRGAKSTTSLYVIRRTNMPAVLLEVCFVDTYQDAQAWWDTPWEPLIDAVVKAFDGVSTGGPVEQSFPESYVLEIDGYWGSATVRACQEALGTTIDGIVSGQDYRDMSAIGGRPTAAWQIGSGGSRMVQALQSKVGVDADGYFGPNTCRALQSYLGTEVDGVISSPSQCVKELQRRLNDGSF
nr:MAG TPA: Cell wall hydrolase autolysin [Caudoviricetes sp.]